MARQKTECNIEGDLRVKEILEERGLLMKDFADQIGITRETLTRALKGNPQYSTLKAIAEGLDVPITDLFKQNEVRSDINGYVEYQGKVYIIKSLEDLNKLTETISK
jgi:transcriptional regulator with XRE-family HTH domain